MTPLIKPVGIWWMGAFLAAAGAQADPLAAAQAAYAEGDFLEAAELAQAVGTADGYAMAADCVTKQGLHLAKDGEAQALFERAVQLAEQAVNLDADSPEAHLQVGQALGRYAETLGKMKALREGYAGKVREAFETAFALDPNRAGTAVALGAWHANIVGRAGGLMARMLGASRGKAVEHFERSLELAPDLNEAYFEYAFGLLAINPKRNRERVRELLAQGIALPPRDAFERLLHQMAAARLAALD